MAKNKPAKTASSTKKVIAKISLVTSDVCEKCQDRCQAGEDYLNSLVLGKIGRGVVCRKQ